MIWKLRPVNINKVSQIGITELIYDIISKFAFLNSDYISWPSKYCDSVQFLCQEEVEDYDWGPEDFYEQIRHIRDNVKNQFEIMLEQKDQANV